MSATKCGDSGMRHNNQIANLPNFFLLLDGYLQMNDMCSDFCYFMVSFLKMVRLESDPHNWGTLIVSSANVFTNMSVNLGYFAIPITEYGRIAGALFCHPLWQHSWCPILPSPVR
jgi:hypothetical protein